jgi:hypothetical protein
MLLCNISTQFYYFSRSPCFRLFVILMESTADSSLPPSTTDKPLDITAASSFANLFLNEINHQDTQGLLDVQRSL